MHDYMRLPQENAPMKTQPLKRYTDPDSRSKSEAARIAALLALSARKKYSETALAFKIAEGVPVGAMDNFAGVYGESFVPHVVPEEIWRKHAKSKKPLPKEYSDRIYKLAQVTDMLGLIYRGDADKVRLFLGRPHPLLDGETPFDIVCSGAAGADAVLNLLRRARAGFPV
ncbi:MAG: DUF2384 domain-containing protein [Gammaproteobacteria bacterium]|nr:DUF2384 domain-containing protein [Gammaproteobacteria bacterium]MDA7962670.1 DUF2384 domain-containing protein [Gammaproteobacteria bacterium]MDA7970500.1 DUF2384 domain-containing protein [Gammaproteobacteria bacterium]MDA8024297.1 DUF2384 domain-containing protein [Gammaproteobacteria bacterium]